MSIASLKVDLVKKILETQNTAVINHIKAVFDNDSSDWYEELPSKIKKSLDKGLIESANGEGRSHAAVMKTYSKWLKK